MTPPAPFRGSQGRPKGRKGFPRPGPGERRPRWESDQRPGGYGKQRRWEHGDRERPRRRDGDDAPGGGYGGGGYGGRRRWEGKTGGQHRPARGEWQPRERNWNQERDNRGPAPGESFPLTEATPPPGDLVWGRHAAEAVLHSERPVHRVWCTGELRFSTRFMEVLREAKSAGVVVEEVSWARLAQLCGGAVHQGIVLQTAAASSVTLQDLLGRCAGSPEAPLLVAVDGITDPHNLGAIARSTEAFGGHGLVAPQRRNAGLTGSVAKVAAGALEHLPVARVVNLNRSLEQLKEAGYTIVGLAGEGGQCVVEIPAGEPLVVVVGSEGTGLSHLTRQYCHQIVRIPLRGQTPHLNAAVACGVVLYEIARQRWLGEMRGSMPTPPAPERRQPTAPPSEPEPSETESRSETESEVAVESVPTPAEERQPPQPHQPVADSTNETDEIDAINAVDSADDSDVAESGNGDSPAAAPPEEPDSPEEPLPVAAPAAAPVAPDPEPTWSSATDGDLRLATHVSL